MARLSRRRHCDLCGNRYRYRSLRVPGYCGGACRQAAFRARRDERYLAAEAHMKALHRAQLEQAGWQFRPGEAARPAPTHIVLEPVDATEALVLCGKTVRKVVGVKDHVWWATTDEAVAIWRAAERGEGSGQVCVPCIHELESQVEKEHATDMS